MHVSLSGQNDVALFNDVESTQNNNDNLIANLKSEPVGRLTNRIPGSCLLISSYQDIQTRLRDRLLNREACYYSQCRPSHATVLVGWGGGLCSIKILMVWLLYHYQHTFSAWSN